MYGFTKCFFVFQVGLVECARERRPTIVEASKVVNAFVFVRFYPMHGIFVCDGGKSRDSLRVG